MAGGYFSFQGIDGKARWRRTAVEDTLPVTCLPYDDRVEMPEGTTAELIVPEHPILAGLGGAWPPLLGVNETEQGPEYLIASESVALEGLGFRFMRDVAPGEAIFIDNDSNMHARQCAENPSLNPCAFEYVYLARPDSVIDGASVYECTSQEEVIDLVQGGQGVFGIAVGRVWREVEGSLAGMPPANGDAEAGEFPGDELSARRARRQQNVS